MNWIISFLAIVSLFSCSEAGHDALLSSKGVLKVDLSMGAGALKEASGGAADPIYKRGAAPDHVKGVSLVADNLDYGHVGNIEKDFFFADGSTGKENVVLEGLTVGENEITAESISKYSPINSRYDLGVTYNDVDLNARAKKYADWLIDPSNGQGLYSKYVANKKVIISGTTPNSVTMDMKAKNHRVAVVMENSSVVLLIKWRISYYKNDSWHYLYESDFMANGDKEAYIINDENAIGSLNYSVTVWYYYYDKTLVLDEYGDYKYVNGHIAANDNDNITRYYRFTREETLDQGYIYVNFSWNKMNNSDIGDTIE